MDNGQLMFLAGAVIVNLLVIYLIIQAAVNSSKAGKHAEYQTKLLAKIAEKNGVTVDEINECYQ